MGRIKLFVINNIYFLIVNNRKVCIKIGGLFNTPTYLLPSRKKIIRHSTGVRGCEL